MLKFQTGRLRDLAEGQQFRILSGRLAQYSEIWTLKDATPTTWRFANSRGVIKVAWEMEEEVMEVEAAS